MIIKTVVGLVSTAILIFSCNAFAQPSTKVGEILDKGGTRLSKEEVTTLLTGATVSGIQTARPDVRFQLTYKPDGVIDGGALRWQTQSDYVSVTGKWSINEKGQTCNALRNSFGQIPAGTGNCSFWFKLGNDYFTGRSEGREELAYPREVKR